MATIAARHAPLTLGTYATELIRPSFTAVVEGKPVVVRLDGSALFKLAEDSGEEARAYLINLHRPRIRDAAQRLFDKGLYQERGTDLEILVTAQDLD